MLASEYNSCLVSVIMPAFNSEKYVSEAIKSVLAQTHSNLELLVVDNGSDDSTIKLVSKLQLLDARIKLVSCDERGASYARNFGTNLAKGKYIAFIDSDDLWDSGKLKLQLSFMFENRISISCTNYTPFSIENGLIKTHAVRKSLSVATYSDLLKTCSIGCSTVVYDVEALGKLFFSHVPKEDYALWLDISRKGVNIGGLLTSLTNYRVSGSSLSGNKVKEIFNQWYVYRQVENVGFFYSCFYIVTYITFGMLKRLK